VQAAHQAEGGKGLANRVADVAAEKFTLRSCLSHVHTSHVESVSSKHLGPPCAQAAPRAALSY
jgi:hypothetical protein